MDSTRPAWTLGRRDPPANLPIGRAWRWCIQRTIRDARLAQHRGRLIAPHHLERLFARRWHGMSEMFNELDRKQLLARLLRGRHFIGKGKQ